MALYHRRVQDFSNGGVKISFRGPGGYGIPPSRVLPRKNVGKITTYKPALMLSRSR